jgi:protein-tyrosine phosphatase
MIISSEYMSKITEKLFVGNSHSARDLEMLRRNGITAIVNVAKDLSDPWFDGIRAYKIGLMDGDSEENKGNISLAAGLIQELIENELATVLVHCHEGRSRSCLVAAVAMCYMDSGLSFTDSVGIVKERRPIGFIKTGLLDQTSRELGLKYEWK